MAGGALALPTTLPVVAVVCGRCAVVLDRMRIDPEDGTVFYAWAPPPRRRARVRGRRAWPRIGARPAGRRPDGFPGDCTEYRCGCGVRAEREFEEIRDAVVRVHEAGFSRVVLGYDL